MDKIHTLLLIVLAVLLILYFTTIPKLPPIQIVEIDKHGGDISELEQAVSFLNSQFGLVI